MNRVRTFIALLAAGVAILASGAGAAPEAANAELALPIASRPSIAAAANLSEPIRDSTEAMDAETMNALGVAQLLGARTPSDYSMAMYWLQRAIDGGSANAMYNLARMYLNGIGIPRDYVNAYKWFGRAAQGGSGHGMHVLALMAENGLGTTPDPPLARAMYREAASSGIPAAMVWVSDDLARRGEAQRDLVEAHAWLQVASRLDLDEQRQILVLAKMEELGERLGPDRRDEARVRASRIVAAIREREVSEVSHRGAVERSVPQAPAPVHPSRPTEARPLLVSAATGQRITAGELSGRVEAAARSGHTMQSGDLQQPAFGFRRSEGHSHEP